MTKSGWIAAVLLLATNAAWVVAWLGKEDGAEHAAPEAVGYEETIAELQDEVARLRQRDPVLIGTGATEAATDSDAVAEGGAASDEGSPAPDPEAGGVAARRRTKADAEARATAKRVNDAAVAAATAMLRKVMQVEDAALRREGLREFADALHGDDTKLIEYTLSALFSMRETEVDRSVFQSIVREHLGSEDGGIRRSALYALYAVDPEGADPRILLESARDPHPIVRAHTARLLGLYGGAKIEGAAADTVIALLADEDPMVRRGTLHGLSRLTVAPEVERTLIDLARAAKDDPQAVYRALGDLKGKSHDVVGTLLGGLDHEDRQVRLRSHQGLQRDVAKSEQRYVAEGYARRLGKFLNPKSQREALKLIVRYGDDGFAPQLDRFAENELVDQGVRQLAQKAAEYLREKKPAR